jgi:hypothetical protein
VLPNPADGHLDLPIPAPCHRHHWWTHRVGRVGRGPPQIFRIFFCYPKLSSLLSLSLYGDIILTTTTLLCPARPPSGLPCRTPSALRRPASSAICLRPSASSAPPVLPDSSRASPGGIAPPSPRAQGRSRRRQAQASS